MGTSDISLLEADLDIPEVRAFTTMRPGGVSVGPYRGLNLADHVGDRSEPVAANRSALAGLLPPELRIIWLQQVHGTEVVSADRVAAGIAPQADAVWSDQPGAGCAVLTADCLPIVLAAANGSQVAAIHAGWRGLAAGVIEATLAAIPQTSADMLAWFGPAIGPCCYEVGAEVRKAFLTAMGNDADRYFVPGQARGKFHADLYGLAALRLHRAGIKGITGGDQCTACDAHNYFSHRRDGQTGRMATLVTLLPS